MNSQTAVLNVRQMCESDRLTVAVGLDTIELMEHAGWAVKSANEQRWSSRPVIVLCGPGNNGGDGFVAARLLAEAGWLVRIALLASRDHLKGAARHHAELWSGDIEPLNPVALDGAELVVDALFGAGLSRALEGAAAETLAAAVSSGLPIVAVDVPSGWMGDTGEVLGAVAAVLTVTFFCKKPGHLLLPGRSLCGEVFVADIGTPASVLEQMEPVRKERLLVCDHRGLWRIGADATFVLAVARTPRVKVCISGDGQLEHQGTQHSFTKGDVFLLPAVVGACVYRPRGAISLLEISLPESY